MEEERLLLLFSAIAPVVSARKLRGEVRVRRGKGWVHGIEKKTARSEREGTMHHQAVRDQY
jgi:hypothetical protein